MMKKFETFGVSIHKGGREIAQARTVADATEIADLLNAKAYRTSKAAVRGLNNALGEITRANYHNSKGSVLCDIATIIQLNGFNVSEFDLLDAPGDTGSFNVSVGDGVYLSFSWYKMGSGQWEIVSYFS